MRRRVLALVLLCFAPLAQAQHAVDTTHRIPRALDADVLDAVRADEAFVYSEQAEEVEGRSLSEILMGYLQALINAASSPAGQPIAYFLLAALVVWGVLKLLRIEPSAAFRRAAAGVRATGDMPEDLSALDYRAEARRARERGEVRLAVRYLFLHVLQQLDAAGRIVYRPQKTNRAYLSELGVLRSEVEPFVRAFEVAWYGHVDPSPSRYDELEQAFARVETRLRDGR